MRKKLALSALSILLTLLLAELALRLLGFGAAGRGSQWFAGGNHPRFLFQPDPVSGYTLRPGFQGREVAPGDEFDVPAAVDARGLRDHPHAAPPRPAVLAVGDSMTFGEGVPTEQSWPAVLEKASGVRVYNAGVPGYASQQMVGRLRKLLPEIHPSRVVMALSPLWDRQRTAAPFVYKEGYIVARGYADRLVLSGGNLYLAETRAPGIGPATAYAKRYSVLMRLALPALGSAARRLVRRRSPEEPPSYDASVRAIEEARGLAQGAGAGFLVLFLDSRGPEFERDRDALGKALAARGIPFVAADSLLPGADWTRLRFPHDGHWNAQGHRAVGEALASLR